MKHRSGRPRAFALLNARALPRGRRFLTLVVAILVTATAISVAVTVTRTPPVRHRGDAATSLAQTGHPGTGSTISLPAPQGRGAAISMPGVGLDAGLEDIAFEGNVLNPPADISKAGLWTGGAPLSARGTTPTVIAGHVSDDEDRPGEFRKLWQARAGMLAVTRDSDGALREWVVRRTQVVPKTSLPRSIFLPGPERVLQLITCASRTITDGDQFHYQDNLIITLAPHRVSTATGTG